MSFRFKPENFGYDQMDIVGPPAMEGHVTIPECAARIANRLLDEFVQTLPEVGGKIDLQFGTPTVWTPLGHNDGQVWRARLWGVEEIKPKCEHDSSEKYDNSEGTRDFVGYAGVCHKCGVKLKPTGWKESE